MIEDQLYRETLLEIYKNPKNRGEIASPDIEARLDNPLCGDEVRIQLKIQNPKSKIQRAVFSGDGCVISQAGASLLAEYLEGKTLDEAKKLGSDDILKIIGINPGPARLGCALLGLNVLKEALFNGVQGKSR